MCVGFFLMFHVFSWFFMIFQGSVFDHVAISFCWKHLLDSQARLKEQLKKDAESIGVAAVKYFDLRQNRNSDYRLEMAGLKPFGPGFGGKSKSKSSIATNPAELEFFVRTPGFAKPPWKWLGARLIPVIVGWSFASLRHSYQQNSLTAMSLTPKTLMKFPPFHIDLASIT